MPELHYGGNAGGGFSGPQYQLYHNLLNQQYNFQNQHYPPTSMMNPLIRGPPSDSGSAVMGQQINCAPGMSQVQQWLKSLRLHKYGDIFATMSYDEMMSLNDDALERKNVTRGARNKILVNIRKLQGRKQMLIDLEADLERDSSVANLRTVMADLKAMIMTPIKPADELTTHFLRVMYKGKSLHPGHGFWS